MTNLPWIGEKNYSSLGRNGSVAVLSCARRTVTVADENWFKIRGWRWRGVSCLVQNRNHTTVRRTPWRLKNIFFYDCKIEIINRISRRNEEEEEEEDDDDDEEEPPGDKHEHNAGRRAPAILPQTTKIISVTRTSKRRPLECYVCAFKSDAPLKACLDPTKYRFVPEV